MRKTRRRGLEQIARRRQRDVLCDVMLSARQCGTWLTLDELAKADALPAGEHFRAVAARAQAGVWRIRGGEAATRSGPWFAWPGLWNGVGVSAPARDSQEIRERSRACRRNAALPANGGSLNRGNGERVR